MARKTGNGSQPQDGMTAKDFGVVFDRFQSTVSRYDCGRFCAPLNNGEPVCCSTDNAIPIVDKTEFELLKGRETGFLLITGPEPATLAEARYFVDRVKDYGVPFSGVLANRVRQVSHPKAGEDELRQALEAASCPVEILDTLVANYQRVRRLALGDEARLNEFAAAIPADVFLVKVPLFAGGLQDLAGLTRLVATLRENDSAV